MCPLRYLYHVLLFLLTNFLIISSANVTEWKAHFDPNPITLKTASRQRVHLVLDGLSEDLMHELKPPNNTNQPYIQLVSRDTNLANVKHQHSMVFFELNNKSVDTNFDLYGEFLGKNLLSLKRPSEFF